MKNEIKKSSNAWSYLFIGFIAVGIWMFYSNRAEVKQMTKNPKETIINLKNNTKLKANNIKNVTIKNAEQLRNTTNQEVQKLQVSVAGTLERGRESFKQSSEKIISNQDASESKVINYEDKTSLEEGQVNTDNPDYSLSDELKSGMSSTVRENIFYKVQKGDTLNMISKEYDIPSAIILEKNPDLKENPDYIVPGKVLKL